MASLSQRSTIPIYEDGLYRPRVGAWWAAWDVTLLRGGGLTASSFTKAFVDVKAREIEEQLAIDVVASSSAARIQKPNRAGHRCRGRRNSAIQYSIFERWNSTSFLSSSSTDQEATSFLFDSSNDQHSRYRYPVQAIDADGDPITFRLLDAPSGATTIDGSTGQITWSPPGQGLYHFPYRQMMDMAESMCKATI